MRTITPHQVIEQARTWLDTKYHHQGRLKKTITGAGGVDCIGLIMGVAKELNIYSKTGKLLSEYDETGYSAYPDGVSLKKFLDTHLHLIEKDQITAGNLLLFRFFTLPQHVGIATDCIDGNLAIIHCYSGSGKVVEHILSPAWQKMLVTSYRFEETEEVEKL